jgi:hypothetical protein
MVLPTEELKRRMNRITVPELAYIAGIVDGECAITMEPRKHPSNGLRCRIPEITLGSVDQELVLWMHERCGGSMSVSKRAHRPNTKDLHRWVLRGAMCKEVTASVLPYLVIERKRLRAEKILTMKGSGWPRTKAEEAYLEQFAQELFAI